MAVETAKGTTTRRSHEKSRQGCRNCKLRRVKCDETRPKCKKCTNFGVQCNFNANVPDLQMLGVGTLTIKPRAEDPLTFTNQVAFRKVEIPAFLYPAIHSNLGLDREHFDRFARFQTRTVLSVGSPKIALMFQSVAGQLSFSEPYLMHMAQAITAIHDRYLTSSPWSSTSKLTTTETFHLSRGAALFNKKLSEPLQNSSRDSLWTAAALLGIISFSTIEAATPEEAWPLQSSEPFDFEWIGMSEYKAVIFRLTNPLRPDSAFHRMSEDYTAHERFMSSYPLGTYGIPPELVELYDLNESSTAENSPYYTAVQKMARLLEEECSRTNIIKYLNFVSHIQPEFKALLRLKDPRALLLFAFWYAKVGRAVWWLERRTIMQGQATCLYLERYHADDAAIQKLLEMPKTRLAELVRTIPS